MHIGEIAAGRARSFLSTSPDVSESEPALSTEAPVDSAARQHDAGDLATELLLQGRTPGHELEAEAIIDHREPARTQGDPLAVDARDVLTFRAMGDRRAWFRRQSSPPRRLVLAFAGYRADHAQR